MFALNIITTTLAVKSYRLLQANEDKIESVSVTVQEINKSTLESINNNKESIKSFREQLSTVYELENVKDQLEQGYEILQRMVDEGVNLR